MGNGNGMWNQKPLINSLLEILIENRGEIIDRRLEELLKKEFPQLNSLLLEEIFLKLESQNIINLFRVSKTKNMIVLNKNNQQIKKRIMKDLP
ncbi:MAG: hypothetical protein GF316_06100 [Candidatus Lokiarchaeota archaeon]|nr:hypothetical protein [Candidatus Lokiarchaeota archaeon]